MSAGYMGAGLGWALRTGGARVVTTVAGRSARTARLAAEADLELLPDLAEVVRAADVVLSVTPPAEALRAAAEIAAVDDTDTLVADLNAISPETMAAVASHLRRPVDGSISGPPPTAKPGARIFLSGPEAQVVAALPWAGLVTPIVVGPEIGAASAAKMCTASIYKGMTALVAQAMRTAGHHGVLDVVIADLERNGIDTHRDVARAATKAHRFVAEMREIARTQEGAGLTPALFAAFAAVYADLAATPLADGDPETTGPLPPDAVVALTKKP
ncbi:NAD(P)-dependent oxidoreductase [Catenuloplanes japonicus]|uniref:NAD(P)-dependent oxidoreductase n=1 Tax=Catenuloplanes japonicus TaxID=33876 RepID=UPI001E5EDCB6|nr:NAD(P)-dependent oxidoreductase [Catenuloplanes japonicus]